MIDRGMDKGMDGMGVGLEDDLSPNLISSSPL